MTPADKGLAFGPIGRLRLRGAGGEPVHLGRTLASHGVATLPPQSVDRDALVLETTVALSAGGARTIRLRPRGGDGVAVEVLGGEPDAATRRRLVGTARTMLGLDEDLSGFYALASGDASMSWVTSGAGRMLRGATVFEDVVKTICTTNCSWSGTVRMVTSIVTELGAPAPGGRRCFPPATAMAEAGEEFYREVARAGYRTSSLVSLATAVADGRLDLEVLREGELSDEEVAARLLALPGVGPYAAAHVMLISLGRYHRLVLDSWTRPTYAKLSGRAATDAAIERRFRRYGDYAGLAFWLFVTRDWLEG